MIWQSENPCHLRENSRDPMFLMRVLVDHSSVLLSRREIGVQA